MEANFRILPGEAQIACQSRMCLTKDGDRHDAAPFGGLQWGNVGVVDFVESPAKVW